MLLAINLDECYSLIHLYILRRVVRNVKGENQIMKMCLKLDLNHQSFVPFEC